MLSDEITLINSSNIGCFVYNSIDFDLALTKQNIIITLMRQLNEYSPSSRNPQKNKLDNRSYVSDFDRKSLLIDRKRNREVNGDKLRLIELDNSLTEPRSRAKNRAHSYYQNYTQDNYEKQLSKVKSEVLRLQQEIQARNSKQQKNRGRQYFPVMSRARTRMLPEQIEVPSTKAYQLRQKPFYNQVKVWKIHNQFNPSVRKKLYKIKKKHKRFLVDTNDEDQYVNAPFADNMALRKYWSRNRQDQSQFIRPVLFKVRHPPAISRIFRSQKNVHRFRKIGNVILFTIRLRIFNQKMRIRRFNIFQKYLKGELNRKLVQLKSELIFYSKPLFTALLDQQGFNYRLYEKDEPMLKKQKIRTVCKLINLQVKYLQKFVNQVTNRQIFSQLLYILCKHGNYTCTQELNTAEQLNLVCISQYYGYVRADKYLEKSALISLVFVKMLLYNIFLQPERIESIYDYKENVKGTFSNLKLIGNILYELFIDIQDQLLDRPPTVYTVGNWNTLKLKFKLKIAESMTVREGFFQRNELISGLASNKYIRDMYGTRQMTEQKQILKVALKKLHQSIAIYHQRFRKQIFIL